MSKGQAMYVVPPSFLSQDWIDQMSLRPAERYYNPAAAGKRLQRILETPGQNLANTRSHFLQELGEFNDFNQRHLGKPLPVRLKAKATPQSRAYDNVTLQDLTPPAPPAPAPPPGPSELMTPRRLLPTPPSKPPPQPRRPFVPLTPPPSTGAQGGPPVQKKKTKKALSKGDPFSPVSKHTRSQKGTGLGHQPAFQYVSFNQYKRNRRVHVSPSF